MIKIGATFQVGGIGVLALGFVPMGRGMVAYAWSTYNTTRD